MAKGVLVPKVTLSLQSFTTRSTDPIGLDAQLRVRSTINLADLER